MKGVEKLELGLAKREYTYSDDQLLRTVYSVAERSLRMKMTPPGLTYLIRV